MSAPAPMGHNLPWPEPVSLLPEKAYRIPGSRRCFQLVTDRPIPFWLLVSLDGENWEPARVKKSAGEAFTTHEPWTWVKWRYHGEPGAAKMMCAWEPWEGFEGVEPWPSVF